MNPNRPQSSSGRLGTTAAPVSRPLGTASRLSTAMNPATARPGTRGGPAGGLALSSQVTVVDRPMTQQGLSGMKTGMKGPQRQIQDKTYFLGLIRGKINDLNAENIKLTKEKENAADENASFLTYEKRAELLALEIRDLQGELGDYNTLVDKLTTDEDIQDVEFDHNDLKSQNDKDAKQIEDLFEIRQQKEEQIRQLETELDQEKRMSDNIVNDMNMEMRSSYFKQKDTNEHLLKQLESGQQELDSLNTKVEHLQEELQLSPIKQEAVSLYEQLHQHEMKKDSLVAEMQEKGTPAEERENLLKKVKEDNQEIASMDRQTNEMQEKLAQMQEEIQQLGMDIEENQGERSHKYKELRKREETMDEFLNTFDSSKTSELSRMDELEAKVVSVMEHISVNMSRFSHLPTPQELDTMKEDLMFKEGEMKKSEVTTFGLAGESEKLQEDLQKVEQLEEKIGMELALLTEKNDTMDREIVVFSNLDALKAQAEDKKLKLQDDRTILQKRRDTFKKSMQTLSSKYEGVKTQLNENETYVQLGNLERKWQHHEQNNFVMKDYIAAKTMECDYRPISKRVYSAIKDYNQILQQTGKHGM